MGLGLGFSYDVVIGVEAHIVTSTHYVDRLTTTTCAFGDLRGNDTVGVGNGRNSESHDDTVTVMMIFF